MKKYKKTKNNVILFIFFFSIFILAPPNIKVSAETTNPVEWIKGNWLNYPDDTGKWTTTTINGNPALGSTQNVDWTGYLNTYALDTKNAVFEFKMYQNEKYDDDNMGWTFRHTYTGSPNDIKNHSYYVFVSNNKSVNGGAYASGLYRKDVGQTTGQMKMLVPMTHLRQPFTLYNIKIEIKDETNGSRIKVYIDGEEVANYLDTNPLPSGGYGPFSFSQAYAFYYDMNINGSSVYNIPPTLTVTSPAQNTSFNPGSSINLIGSANDVDNRGTLSTYYQIDNGTQQLIWTNTQTGSPIAINKSIPISSSIGYGNHTLTVWAKDSENAESKREVINFFVNDITKPTATHKIVAETNGTKTISIVANDTESGVKRIQLPDGNYVNGSTTNLNVPNKNSDYIFKIEDNAGNILSYTVTVSDALVIPNLTANSVPSSNLISLNWSINDTWQTYTYNIYRKLQTEDSYSIVSSNVSNISYNDTLAKDLAKPSIPTITGVIANGATSTISINFNKSVDYGTIYNHYIESVGSKNSAKSSSNITTTEINTGIKGYSIVVDNSPTTIPDNVVETISTSYQLSKEITGQFYVHICAVDNAGNKSEVQHYLYSDSFSPSMTLTPNTINWTKGDITIVVNANDNETGVKRIKLPNGNYVNGAIATFTVSTNGTYEFTAEDYAGNAFSKTIVVQNIDKTKPTVSHSFLTETTNGVYVDKTSINITAKDTQSGVKRIKLPNGNYVNSSTTNYEVTANGNYTFLVEDNVGNTTSYTVNISNLVFKPVLNVTPHHSEDYISLDWSISDTGQPYTYKLFQERNNSGEFQSISANNLKDKIKVLNIYPSVSTTITFTTYDGETLTLPKSASLKMWMETPNSENSKGYGMGLIEVDAVSISKFNLNPNKYLKDDNGDYLYDVINVGNWNFNNHQDISDSGIIEIRNFIKSGRGYLSGHDTSWVYHKNLGSLKDLLNMKYAIFSEYDGRTYDINYPADFEIPVYGIIGNQVTINKKGILNNYPWNLGEVGTVLNIPIAHTTGQYVYGDVWMNFTNKEETKDPNNEGFGNWYLSSWNNVAMIQTGHSNGEATTDEQKLLANTLFYLSQLTSDTHLDDQSGQDVNAPTTPTITGHSFNNKNITVSFNGSTDVGTFYRYYVEATGQNNGAKTNSDIKETTITSGLKGYSYVVDTNPTTVPDNTIETSTPTNISFTITNKTMYVHVKAIDNVGNASETVHYKVEDLNKPTLNVTGNATTWTSGNVTLNVNASDLESGFAYILLPNGTRVTSSTTSYTVSSNGAYTFKAYDNVGNETIVNVVVNKIDKELPTINYTKEFNSNKTSGYINLSVVDSLSGFAKLELPSGEIITTSTYKYPISNNGMYIFSAWDKVGNKSLIVVTVDELNANNTPSGISRIEYKLSGATTKDWTTYTEPFYIINEGITTITAKSYDLAGNISSEVISQVKIDKTKPINNGIEIKLK